MIQIGTKTFRNLEEQVAYLTKIMGEQTFVFGTIKDVVPTIADLPSLSGVAIGDVYLVGASAPYDYMVAVPDGLVSQWLNIGTFPLKGDDGSDGVSGSAIYYCQQSGLKTSGVIFSMIHITIPSGHPIQVGDLILNVNCNLYKITAVGTTYVVCDYLTTLTSTPISSLVLDGDMTVTYDSHDGATITYDGEVDGNTVNITERLPIRGDSSIDITLNDDGDMIKIGVNPLGLPIAGDGHLGVVAAGPNSLFGFNTFAGLPMAIQFDYPTYSGRGGGLFVGKGTLETVLDNEVVRVDKAQTLTDAQKAQARENIGSPEIIYYDVTTETFPEGFSLMYKGANVKVKDIYDREMAGIRQILRVTHPDPDYENYMETDICLLDDIRYNEVEDKYFIIFQSRRYYNQIVRYAATGVSSTANLWLSNTVI